MAQTGETGDEWLKQEKREMEDKEEGLWQDLTLLDLKVELRTTSKEKAPGLDQVHKFWLKQLTCLHIQIISIYNHILHNPEDALEWLTGGTYYPIV